MHPLNPTLHLIKFPSDFISSPTSSFKASKNVCMAVFSNGYSLHPSKPVPSSFYRRFPKQPGCVPPFIVFPDNVRAKQLSAFQFFRQSTFRLSYAFTIMKGIYPEFFLAGVCCGGLVTLSIQLGIGFLMRKRPVFALATVVTVEGIWTVFPYVVAASTALFLYLRRRYST